MSKKSKESTNLGTVKVRLDKWLWAARFYKTRAIAKQAIDGGKVHCQGSRAKPSKDVEVGMEITLRQGLEDKTIIIRAVSEHRRGAPEAQALYEETAASLQEREKKAALHKAQPSHWAGQSKPNKKDRRLIQQFKQKN